MSAEGGYQVFRVEVHWWPGLVVVGLLTLAAVVAAIVVVGRRRRGR